MNKLKPVTQRDFLNGWSFSKAAVQKITLNDGHRPGAEVQTDWLVLRWAHNHALR